MLVNMTWVSSRTFKVFWKMWPFQKWIGNSSEKSWKQEKFFGSCKRLHTWLWSGSAFVHTRMLLSNPAKSTFVFKQIFKSSGELSKISSLLRILWNAKQIIEFFTEKDGSTDRSLFSWCFFFEVWLVFFFFFGLTGFCKALLAAFTSEQSA